MNEIGYLGGIFNTADRFGNSPPDSDNGVDDYWCWEQGDHVCILEKRGDHCQLASKEHLCALMIGQVRRTDDPEAGHWGIAEYVLQHYRQTQTLPMNTLEGSFSILLLDGLYHRGLFYRNLIGNTYTYYSQTGDGFVFGSNLSTLAHAGLITLKLNESVLPSYFFARHLSGRDTFFKNTFRLLPGEFLSATSADYHRSQRSTFRDLIVPSAQLTSPLEQFEGVFQDVLSHCRLTRPRTANLLSGGVDSSLIQAHWNDLEENRNESPWSFCASVDHPRLKLDTEYALSASRMLGTRHVIAEAAHPPGDSLQSTIAAIAEPPHHLQVTYSQLVAQTMAEHHCTTGLCGEAADSLFGLDAARGIQNARLLQKILPLRSLRSLGSLFCRFIRRPRWASYFNLANVMSDPEDWGHPLSTVARFTDWNAVKICFGSKEINRLLEERRGLLEQYQVKSHLLEQVHALGTLSSAVNTASLKSALFQTQGIDLVNPFLDSRTLSFVMNLPVPVRFPWRKPKALLKESLARRASPELATRRKLGFGQPLFEWLSPSGGLAPLVEDIDDYPFVCPQVLRETRERPTWFLYSLLCFDLWYKQFIRQSLSPSKDRWLPRSARAMQSQNQTTLV